MVDLVEVQLTILGSAFPAQGATQGHCKSVWILWRYALLFFNFGCVRHGDYSSVSVNDVLIGGTSTRGFSHTFFLNGS